MLRETYKHLACLAPAGNIPSIGSNLLSDVILHCNDFVDSKAMKLSDVDLAFIASNAYSNKKFPYRSDFIINPERQIIRYQFLEVMIRLALERFSLRQKMSALDAVKLFYE